MVERSTKRVAAVLWLLFPAAFGQKLDPIQWRFEGHPARVEPGGKITARLFAAIAPGWHLYSPTTPPGGPIPTTIRLEDNAAIAKASFYQPAPERKLDPNFNLDVELFAGEVPFFLEANVKADAPPGPLTLTAAVRYQACDDKQCLPPRKKTVTLDTSVDRAAKAIPLALPAGYRSIDQPSAPSAPQPAAPREEGLVRYLLVAFGFGLASLFTPCVFPMIPMTVSYFLGQQSGSRRAGLQQALVFCLGIVVLFTALGFAVTAIAGASGVVRMGSNPWVNGFIAAVFFAFALSLLGAFEITLPSSVLTRLDNASRQGGYLGTLLMGLTFSLTSFACVGPFVGTLLAASVKSGGLQPVAGMMSFATGLATPFFFLALFPSYLGKLPRSGGWMSRVKVVLGFVILAAMFKYLATVDQVLQTNWLSRELFLAAWIVLFALPGLYLLGWVRLEGVKPDEPLGVGRLLIAAAFLIFAVSLVPGLYGANLGAIETFVPAATTAASGAPGGAESLVWMKDRYQDALDQAKRENKLVLVTFTGYACTNCHWMKANMFTRPEIAQAARQLVLVELFTDGSDAASIENQKMQERLFATVAIPYYALLDPTGKPVASFPGLTRDTNEFLKFLTTRT